MCIGHTRTHTHTRARLWVSAIMASLQFSAFLLLPPFFFHRAPCRASTTLTVFHTSTQLLRYPITCKTRVRTAHNTRFMEVFGMLVQSCTSIPAHVRQHCRGVQLPWIPPVVSVLTHSVEDGSSSKDEKRLKAEEPHGTHAVMRACREDRMLQTNSLALLPRPASECASAPLGSN
uniref:Excreted/secreted protein 78 n=1 Tax=Leishmania major TaxID=5664 RepID=Q1X7K1_LEIMA|nr:excreted/secreted protein 78 [Leishmania major]